MKKIIFLSLLFSLLLIPLANSSVVEIEIEYENITTSTTSTTTSTVMPSGGGGGPLITTTTITRVEKVPGIGYEMPASFEVYENETVSFRVNIKNTGDTNLTNLILKISGIPSNSFSITPSLISSLEPNSTSNFFVFINSTSLAPGNYTLTLNLISNEVSENTTLLLSVKQYPREVGEKLKKGEKTEEIKSVWNTFKYLFVSIVIVGIILLGLMFVFRKTERCIVCGAKLEKEREDEYFVYYKCPVCGYKSVKPKK